MNVVGLMVMTIDMLIRIVGWGLAPRMAPRFDMREGKRHKMYKRERERERENFFIHFP